MAAGCSELPESLKLRMEDERCRLHFEYPSWLFMTLSAMKRFYLRGRPAPNESGRITLLAALSSPTHREVLSNLASRCGWDLRTPDGSAAVRSTLESASAPIVFWDRDLPEMDWREAFSVVRRSRRGQCAILISPVTDDYLWQAVIELGGYDVLTRPLQEQKVLEMVSAAWLYWKTSYETSPFRTA